VHCVKFYCIPEYYTIFWCLSENAWIQSWRALVAKLQTILLTQGYATGSGNITSVVMLLKHYQALAADDVSLFCKAIWTDGCQSLFLLQCYKKYKWVQLCMWLPLCYWLPVGNVFAIFSHTKVHVGKMFILWERFIDFERCHDQSDTWIVNMILCKN